MNSTEHIVDAYFRLVRCCFTSPDIKIDKGNNCQFDLLAKNLVSGENYHIEVGVTHIEKWCPTVRSLEDQFKQKFFGYPQTRSGPNTDSSKGKKYTEAIRETYKTYGLDFNDITRVWCCWSVKDSKSPDIELANLFEEITSKEKLKKFKPLQYLSFRDEVLPKLIERVKTSNYDDEILRTFSLLNAFDMQKSKLNLK
jgi:hypothetical protein